MINDQKQRNGVHGTLRSQAELIKSFPQSLKMAVFVIRIFPYDKSGPFSTRKRQRWPALPVWEGRTLNKDSVFVRCKWDSRHIARGAMIINRGGHCIERWRMEQEIEIHNSVS